MWSLKSLLGSFNHLLMIDRDFFKCLKPINFSVFTPRLKVLVLGYVFNLPVFNNFILIFISCLRRVSRWARRERFGPNRVFLRQLCVWEQPTRSTRNMSKLFKASFVYLISKIFHLRPLPVPCYIQIVSQLRQLWY